MERYHAPQPPPAAQDPVRQAAWDGYITLITTLLPTLRTGREARPAELKTAWERLRAAINATGSATLDKLLSDLPTNPTAGDLAPLTAELTRVAQIRSRQP
ncbi:MAG TPA: hypothetical protein VF062_27260 [Candidatus Limnocylindrales bacterium]